MRTSRGPRVGYGAHRWGAIVLLCIAAAVGRGLAAETKPDATRAAAPLAEPKITEWQVPRQRFVRDPVIDADGNVIFADARRDRIVKFDAKARRFSEWPLPAGTAPHGLAIARDGRVFYGGRGHGALGELDPATGTVREYSTSSADSKPYSVTIDAKGNVWVTLRGIDRVGRLDRATGRIVEYPMCGEPYGITFDSRGAAWVTCIAGDRLGVIDPATGTTAELATGAGSKPRRLALDGNGMLWVSLYGNGTLIKVDPAAKSVVAKYPLPGGENAGPYSVNVDAAGRVWVNEHQTDSIAVFDPRRERFQVIRLPVRDSGVRNAIMDRQYRFWYLGTTRGRLGLIE